MPNVAEHMTISGTAAAFTYLVMCRRYHRQTCIGDAITCIGAGVVSGVAPDLLEPALHPHHRQFCHSLTAGTLLLKVRKTLCSDGNQEWTQFTKIFTTCIVVGYLVNLVLDGCTPKGLPLLGK